MQVFCLFTKNFSHTLLVYSNLMTKHIYSISYDVRILDITFPRGCAVGWPIRNLFQIYIKSLWKIYLWFTLITNQKLVPNYILQPLWATLDLVFLHRCISEKREKEIDYSRFILASARYKYFARLGETLYIKSNVTIEPRRRRCSM